jgi:hypothetical protein
MGQRQRDTPGAARHQPPLDAGLRAQRLDIGQRVAGGVGGKRGER